MTKSAWVLSAADALQKADSWGGRTHFHKLLYLADRLAEAPQPFKIELYQFGPYSFDLDSSIRDLTVCGLIKKAPQPSGFGASYRASSDWKSSVDDDLKRDDHAKLDKVANALAQLPTADLELIATCHWMEDQKLLTDDKAIVSAVQQVKPRYKQEMIRKNLGKLREISQMIEK